MKVTIDEVEYDVPDAVAEYVKAKQAAERRAIKLGRQLVDGTAYCAALRFCDLPEKQQFAYILQRLVNHQKGTLSLMELSVEFAAMYKAARTKEK